MPTFVLEPHMAWHKIVFNLLLRCFFTISHPIGQDEKMFYRVIGHPAESTSARKLWVIIAGNKGRFFPHEDTRCLDPSIVDLPLSQSLQQRWRPFYQWLLQAVSVRRKAFESMAGVILFRLSSILHLIFSGPKNDLAHQLLGEVNKLLLDHD